MSIFEERALFGSSSLLGSPSLSCSGVKAM